MKRWIERNMASFIQLYDVIPCDAIASFFKMPNLT
jgi:hypothetical protein